MTEILFYHLEEESLDGVLPQLLSRSLERDWQVVVEFGSQDVLQRLNRHLWEYRDEAFLPHGASEDGFAHRQPVWLTLDNDNPNNATVRFYVDGTGPEDMEILSDYDRVVVIFSEHKESELVKARTFWQRVKQAGMDASYWRKEQGSWKKQG